MWMLKYYHENLNNIIMIMSFWVRIQIIVDILSLKYRRLRSG